LTRLRAERMHGHLSLAEIAMLDAVADVETATARSPDTRAAIQYLQASGAAAISVTGKGISVGMNMPDAFAIFWLPADKARSVASRARNQADGADVEMSISALYESASKYQCKLTSHRVAMERAAEAAQRLDAFMDSLRGTGVLREFTKTYKRRRLAAAERGEGFMSYANAERRLRLALIPLLVNGGKPAVGQSLFATIFDAHR